MNRIIFILKSLIVLLIGWYLSYVVIYPSYFSESDDPKIRSREEANFLDFNDSIIAELENKKIYDWIYQLQEDEKSKNELFEDPDFNTYFE